MATRQGAPSALPSFPGRGGCPQPPLPPDSVRFSIPDPRGACLPLAAPLSIAGVKLEHTMAGLEARLTPHGAGRWGGAAFLAVWLLFWTLGEVIVGWILIAGGWALITGEPPGPGREPLAVGPSLFAGVFMLAWLAFWTLGGFMAWHEFFRLVWSSDRLLARTDGLEVVNRVGPFTRRRWLPRDTLRGFFCIAAHQAVQAETSAGGEGAAHRDLDR